MILAKKDAGRESTKLGSERESEIVRESVREYEREMVFQLQKKQKLEKRQTPKGIEEKQVDSIRKIKCLRR